MTTSLVPQASLTLALTLFDKQGLGVRCQARVMQKTYVNQSPDNLTLLTPGPHDLMRAHVRAREGAWLSGVSGVRFSPYLLGKEREKRTLASRAGPDTHLTPCQVGEALNIGRLSWLRGRVWRSWENSASIGGGELARAEPTTELREVGERGEADQRVSGVDWPRVGQQRVGQSSQRVDLAARAGGRPADCGSAGPEGHALNSRAEGGTPGFRAATVRGPLSPRFDLRPGVCLSIGSHRKINASQTGWGGGRHAGASTRCGHSTSATLRRRFGEVN